MTVDEEFSKSLREERIRVGLTQEQVVAGMRELGHTNFHAATIVKIESNKSESNRRKVTVGEAFALAEVLGVPLQQLLPKQKADARFNAEIAGIDVDLYREYQKMSPAERAKLDFFGAQKKLERIINRLEARDG